MSENNESLNKKVKRLRLTNSRDVRRYISNLMKRVENSEIEESKARLLNNLAETILKSIRSDELEKKLLEIEEMINDNNNKLEAEATYDDNFYLKKIK